jgi:hypothetical protein
MGVNVAEHASFLSVNQGGGLYFTTSDRTEVHHKDRNHTNYRFTNLILLHRHCHDTVHSAHDTGHQVEKLHDRKQCAMVRTERIASRGGRSSRQMTSRRPILPDSERIGNNSMMGKREMTEDV